MIGESFLQSSIKPGGDHCILLIVDLVADLVWIHLEVGQFGRIELVENALGRLRLEHSLFVGELVAVELCHGRFPPVCIVAKQVEDVTALGFSLNLILALSVSP